jgi:hypothetical protein
VIKISLKIAYLNYDCLEGKGLREHMNFARLAGYHLRRIMEERALSNTREPGVEPVKEKIEG